MSYYSGTARGDYYRGDFWSKLGKGIKKLGKNIGRVVKPLVPIAAAFIPGVGGLISKGLAIKAKAENVVKAYTQPLAGPLGTVSGGYPTIGMQSYGASGVVMVPPVPGAIPMATLARGSAPRAAARRKTAKRKVKIVYRYRTRPKRRTTTRRRR